MTMPGIDQGVRIIGRWLSVIGIFIDARAIPFIASVVIALGSSYYVYLHLKERTDRFDVDIQRLNKRLNTATDGSFIPITVRLNNTDKERRIYLAASHASEIRMRIIGNRRVIKHFLELHINSYSLEPWHYAFDHARPVRKSQLDQRDYQVFTIGLKGNERELEEIRRTTGSDQFNIDFLFLIRYPLTTMREAENVIRE